MLTVDVPTCYLLCGFGAALGGGLMQLVHTTDQPHVQQSVKRYKAGLWLLSAMALQAFVPAPWHDLALRIAIAMAATGVACLGWAFHELNGRLSGSQYGWLGVGWVAGMSAFAVWQEPRVFMLLMYCVFGLAGLAISLDQAVLAWRSPRLRMSELILLFIATVFTINWLLTLNHALHTTEPIPPHWVHAPAWLLPWSGLAFAVLPITVAAVALTIINDRLVRMLRNRALSDDLTGALSRRGLRELGEQMLAMQASHPNLVAVLMVDVDHFKSINDRYGHQVGDEVLRHVTQVIRNHLRPDASLARYGGEEFTVLLPLRSVDEAVVVAERLRQAVERSPCESRLGPVQAQVSIGVGYHRPGGTLDEALGRADERLYAAKQTGRNRVMVASV